MTYWDYDEDVRNNIEFLNTIDFTRYLANNYIIEQVIDDVEYDYDKSNLPSWLDGNVFNYLTEEEVVEYLKQRYNIPVWHHITHRYQWKGVK